MKRINGCTPAWTVWSETRPTWSFAKPKYNAKAIKVYQAKFEETGSHQIARSYADRTQIAHEMGTETETEAARIRCVQPQPKI